MKRIQPSNSIFRKLSVTTWLIILNVITYIIFISLSVSGYAEQQLLNIFALQAQAIFAGSFWTLLTSMFTHVWLPHLFFNMISLFFIGNLLEKIIGRKKFLYFYLISGIFAGIFYSVLSFYLGNTELGARIFVSPLTYSVGASGAIFGIAGLLAILTPHMKVYLIMGPIIAIILQSLLSSIFPDLALLPILNLLLTAYIFFAIFTMFSFSPGLRRFSIPMGMPFYMLPIIAIVPLVIIGLFVSLPIGNTAHLGGLIAGLIYGSYLKRRYKRKTALISRYFN
jgi:membrane associated rhomboid family serine protease